MDEQKVRQIIVDMLAAEQNGTDEVASRTAQSDGELSLSSLELVRLLVSLEERLGISLDDAVILNARFDTVDDIVALVTRSA